MKKMLFCLTFGSLIFSTSSSQTQFVIDINRIFLPIDNSGILADVNINPYGAGGRLDDVVFLFSGGFFLSGYSNDSLWSNGVSSSLHVRDYLPGTVGSSASDPRNRIYVVKSSDTPFGASWQNWVEAVSLGASYYDGNNDGIYNPVDLNSNGTWDLNEDKPDILGDITAWCVYNDGLPASQRRYKDVEPQGIEIHQTVFCYDSLNINYPNLENTFFVRYKIINKGTAASVLDSVIFGLWADPDIGDYVDDKVGSDTLFNSVFAYKTSLDFAYGINPPAVYLTFLQFPHTYIPNVTFIDNNLNGFFDYGIDTPLDSAIYYEGKDLGVKIISGAKNVSNSSSMGYKKGDPLTGDPTTKVVVRNYLKARLKAGQTVDPCNWLYTFVAGGVNCAEINPYFWASGNPIDSIGWLWKTGSDVRTMANAGVFKLIQNEPVEIIVAYTAARGLNALNSILATKLKAEAAINHYVTNFGQFPSGINDKDEIIISEFKLFQNYPNPFNPSTKISFTVPNVGTGLALSVLKVYDVLGNEVATLLNEYKPAGRYEVEFNPVSGICNLPSGVYFYQLKANNFIQTKKMILIR